RPRLGANSPESVMITQQQGCCMNAVWPCTGDDRVTAGTPGSGAAAHASRVARCALSGSGHCGVVTLNPPAQYADDRNLRARQRFWRHQDPYFDIVGWVMDLARLSPGLRVLDAGCGNGAYLRAVRDRQAIAVGCDLSM